MAVHHIVVRDFVAIRIVRALFDLFECASGWPSSRDEHVVRHILFFLHIDQITHIATMERLSDTEVGLPATAASSTSVAMLGLLLGGLRR